MSDPDRETISGAKRLIKTVASACVASTLFLSPAVAGGESFKPASPAPAASVPWGPGWMLRLRGIGVIPDEDSGAFTLNGAALPAGTVGVSITDQAVPELDISYFFTPNIAAELILAVSPHDITGSGITGAGLNLDALLLPPTLTLQYHLNAGGKFKPYVGAGVNYTHFFEGDPSGAYAGGALVPVDLDLDDSFGLALQVGIDVHIAGNMWLNVDVKKVFIDTEATITNSNGSVVKGNVDIDPWIIGFGVGWKL